LRRFANSPVVVKAACLATNYQGELKNMAHPRILHMLTPLKHMSPFDVNMALDAGYDAVIPYTSVTIEDVTGLVQDAIFSRGPDGVKRTGMFIAGKRAVEALDMLERAKKAMVPPFVISVFSDPAGSFTTAAAMVACVNQALKERFSTNLKGKTIAVYGGTGVVGFASAVIAALEGATATLIGYDGPDRVKKFAELIKERFGVDVGYADGSTEQQKADLVRDADVVFAAGPAGRRLLSLDQLKQAKKLKVVTDVNAVPPAGIEGVGVNDDEVPIPGTNAVAIGALAVGNIKYKTEAGLFRQMIESEKPLYLDFRDAYTLAQKLTA
jgi:methylene-tetrahydromethanopterin dehydrogenase